MKNFKEAEVIENTLMHFPDEVSRDISDYVTEDVLYESRYLFVKRKGSMRRAYCTYCKKQQDADGLKHKEEFTCVHCKSDCYVQFAGYSRKKMIDKAYIVYYEKSEANDKAMIARGFRVWMDYTGDYKDVKPQFEVMGKYLFEMDNAVFIKKERSWPDNEKYYELRKSVFSLFSYTTAFGHYNERIQEVSEDSIEEAVKGTPFQYSMWKNTLSAEDYVKHFATYAKHPQIEYLSKLGLQTFVDKKVHRVSMNRCINWRGKTLHKVLRVPKQYMKEIINNAINVDVFVLSTFQDGIRSGYYLSIEEIVEIKQESLQYYWKNIREKIERKNIRKFINYLKRQTKRSEYRDLGAVYLRLRDYWNGCKTLNLVPGEDIAEYPSNLQRAHDNIYNQIKYKEDKELNDKIESRIKELSKYEFENEIFVLRPFTSSKEIIEEGKQLKHCVGGYMERYANGETNLFAIRTKLDPEQPLYTMEAIDGKVRQYYGYKNKREILAEEVEEFVEQFEKTKLNKEMAI